MRKMKDTIYPWLGKIPVSWNTSKLLYCLRQQICDGPHETPNVIDDGIPFISIDSLNESKHVDLSIVKKFISEEDYLMYRQKTNLEKGDILFSKSATIGKTAIVGDEVFMVWSPLAIIKSKVDSIQNEYLYYLLNCDELIASIRLSGSFNTQANVGMREMERAVIPVPPLDEQKIVAQFLDSKCAEIDALSADIQSEIDTLEAYKRSVITEAVTKGLDKNAPMKDSGTQWLGCIPAHWNISRIGSVYKLRNTKVSDKDYGPLSVTMKGVVPQLDSAAKTNAHDDRKLVKEGDFVINSRSDRRGSCGISPIDGSVSLINTVLAPLDEMNPEYYDWLFHTAEFADEFYKCGHGIVDDLWTTGWQDMKRILISYPPLEEQANIAEYLNDMCSDIDAIIAQKQEQLAVLADYKKSIIYEYVTGKKEVPVA